MIAHTNMPKSMAVDLTSLHYRHGATCPGFASPDCVSQGLYQLQLAVVNLAMLRQTGVAVGFVEHLEYPTVAPPGGEALPKVPQRTSIS